MAEINQAYEVLSDPGNTSINKKWLHKLISEIAKREQFDNGFDPFDPEAGAHQQNPFNFHGGDNPFAHFAGGGHGFPFGSTGGFTFHF
jgi:DnaJ family protein C protein 3